MARVMRILGLIPARAGSKGIPGKNLKPVAGRPLIWYTLKAARESCVLDRCILSTDCPRTRELGIRFGVECPFLRPHELATDRSTQVQVAIHALEWLQEHDGYRPTHLMLLQPTSPIRTSLDIRNAVGLLEEANAEAVVSVAEQGSHPYLGKLVDHDGRLMPLLPYKPGRRQDMPKSYALNGAIYLVEVGSFLAERSWCPPGSTAYIMPPERSIDVDSPWDLYLADLIIRDAVPFDVAAPESVPLERTAPT